MENRNEMEIDLLGLFIQLKNKIWIILLATLVFTLGGYIVAKSGITPVYTASMRLYIYQKNNSSGASIPDNNSLSVATQLLRDCAVIITGENVTKPVVEKLDLSMSAKSLSKAIEVTYKENTRILELQYTDTNPERAAEVLNAVCEEAAAQIEDITGVDAVEPIYKASVPTAESNVNIKKSTITAAIIGAVLSTAVLVVIFMLDDTIRTEDDVENHLGLSTLAAIPVSAELRVARPTRKGKKPGQRLKKKVSKR